MLSRPRTPPEAESAAQIRQKFFATADKGGFADIWGESEETQKAITEAIDKRLKSGQSNTWETYETVGKEFRARKSPSAKPTMDLSGERREKKRVIDNVDPTRGRQPQNKPADKPTTERDIRRNAIAEIMKARGQLT